MKSLVIGQELTVNGKQLVLSNSYIIDTNKKGYFILDFNNQFECPCLNKLPAVYVECVTEIDRFELFKYNVILGEREDICLI